MNIVVINGSPRSKGNTMKVIALIETEMKELNPQTNFEYVHLGEIFMHASKDKADYQYWSAQGWLDPGKVYYIDARVNPLKLALARILGKFQVKKYPKGKGS